MMAKKYAEFLALALLLISPIVRGQESESRSTRIAQALARMDSVNSVEREVATEENLASSDPILRSQALAKALHMGDRVVRELALSTLIENQKVWIVDITVTDRDLKLLPDSLKDVFTNLKTGNLTISDFNQKTGMLNGILRTGRYSIGGIGSINQDGFSVQLEQGNNICKLYFASEHDGSLIGAITCSTASFPIRSALQ